jgi:diguanylate cyclase
VDPLTSGAGVRSRLPQPATGSGEQWHTLVDNSPVAVAVLDGRGNFVYANPRAVALYGGVDQVDLLGRPASEFVEAGSEQMTRSQFVETLRGETIAGLQSVMRPISRAPVDVEIYATRVVWQHEPAVQVELRDVSKQVAAEAALRESERRWRSLIDGSPVGIGLADERGLYIAANPALCAFLGRSEADILGHSDAEFTHTGDLADHRRTGAAIKRSPDGVVRMEKRYLRPDGDLRWAWLTVTHVSGPQGEVWTVGHVQDITDRRATEQSVIDSEANLASVAKVVKQIQSGTDARQTVVDAAATLAQGSVAALFEPVAGGAKLRVSATTDAALLGQEVGIDSAWVSVKAFTSGQPIFVPETAGDHEESAAWSRLGTARSFYVVPVASAEAVTGVLVVGWSRPMSDLGSRSAAVVRLLADHAGVALRQATLLSELESLALSDPLTGLPNRRSWEQHLQLTLAAARRRRSPLTVALADLDHFKRFNDTRGHLAGDELLQTFAAHARTSVREVDIVARWGGEEFAVALPDCPSEEAPAVLGRIAAALPEEQTCSIGYATWDGIESAADLMARADRALYGAKRAGRNRMLAD